VPEILFQFVEEATNQKSQLALSDFLKNNLIINVFAPMLTALGIYQQKRELIEKALNWLSSIPPEPNAVTRQWQSLGLKIENSSQSQSLNELSKQYCQKKKCMDCNIGRSIISGKFQQDL
jgi:hypothetical protein